VENTFECSGICTPLPFYAFSDINNGVPKNDYDGNFGNKGTGCRGIIEKQIIKLK